MLSSREMFFLFKCTVYCCISLLVLMLKTKKRKREVLIEDSLISTRKNMLVVNCTAPDKITQGFSV